MAEKINTQLWSALKWERMWKSGRLGLDQVIYNMVGGIWSLKIQPMSCFQVNGRIGVTLLVRVNGIKRIRNSVWIPLKFKARVTNKNAGIRSISTAKSLSQRSDLSRTLSPYKYTSVYFTSWNMYFVVDGQLIHIIRY